MRDHLRDWCRIRELIRWDELAEPVTGPVRGRRDGFVDHVRTLAPARASALLHALGRVRAAAADGTGLSFDALAGWLGVPVARFRAGTAYAKGGRERYGLHADTEDRFRDCLAQARDPSVPLASRTARAYLDVAFFHPFDDGNGRAAMLCAYFVLLRDDVVLDLAAPMLRTIRRADDPDGAADLVRLLTALINGTRRRGHDRSGPAAVTARAGPPPRTPGGRCPG